MVNGGSNVDLKTVGSISAGGGTTANYRVQAGGAADVSGQVQAGEILIDGASVNSTAVLIATSDIAIRARSGSAALGSTSAGDDIVVRATGDVTATGPLTAGTGSDGVGYADRLVAAEQKLTVLSRQFDITGGSDIELQGVKTGHIRCN